MLYGLSMFKVKFANLDEAREFANIMEDETGECGDLNEEEKSLTYRNPLEGDVSDIISDYVTDKDCAGDLYLYNQSTEKWDVFIIFEDGIDPENKSVEFEDIKL